MRRVLVALLAALVSSCCEPAFNARTPDAGAAAVDSTVAIGGDTAPALDVEEDTTPCTEWACIVHCWDGGCYCEKTCKSYDPATCPGPWPCIDGGAEVQP